MHWPWNRRDRKLNEEVESHLRMAVQDRVDRGESGPEAFESARHIAIVGVVRDFINRGMAQTPAPQILTLFRQMPGLNAGFKDIVVGTATDPESIVPAVARELQSLDADVPLGEIRHMEAHMSNQTADTRLITVLLGLFAGPRFSCFS